MLFEYWWILPFCWILEIIQKKKKNETKGSEKNYIIKVTKKLYNKTCVTESLLYKINPNINNPRKVISF